MTSMRILLVGAVATLLGVGGGSLVTGSRLKGDIIERLEEEASDASRGAERRDTRDDGSSEGTSDPTAVPASVDLSASQPAAEENSPDGGQELDQPPATGGGSDVEEPSRPATGGGESIGQEPSQPAPSDGGLSEPAPSTASLDTASEVTVQGDSGTNGSQGIDPEASSAMARIFAAMRPADAAAVLQGMENLEVRAILLSMGNRQAAQILGGFEADRAAALAQLILLTRTNGS